MIGVGCGDDPPEDEPQVSEGVYSPPDRATILEEETVWQVGSERLYMSLPAVSPSGTIYAGGWDGTLYAVSPDGTVDWRFETGDKIDAAPTVDAQGRVLVASWDGSLYALDSDGSEQWSFEAGAPVDVSASVDADGRVYIASTEGRLVRLMADGSVDWDIDLGAAATTSISVFDDGQDIRAYVGTTEPSVKCVENGTVTGTATVQSQPMQDIALTEEGDAIVSLGTGRVVRIAPDCSISWGVDLTYAVVQGAVLDQQGRALVGQHAEQIHAISLEDGSEVWTSDTRTLGQPLNGMHVGNDGLVYAGADGVISVDAQGNIEVLSKLDVLSTPVIADGAPFATTERGELVRLELTLPPLADTPWPTQQANLQRTGYLEGGQ